MVFRSSLPEIEIPPTSLPAFVLEHAASFGNKPALIDGRVLVERERSKSG
jgi:hypothetical protein